ncbi:25_t:CDS:2, partial [Funneliformis caledonium]
FAKYLWVLAYMSYQHQPFKDPSLSLALSLFLQLVNDERSKVGAPALTLDGRLTQAAQTQNRLYGQRVRNTGYVYSNVSENVAEGYGTNEEVRVMQGIRGCGETYWTQVFASPLEQTGDFA